MARLIDFHGNCACGRDAHVTGQLDDEGYLRVQLETSGGRCGQTADAGAYLGEAMAQLRAQSPADDGEAINDAADAAEVDDEPVATTAPAQAPAAPPRRGRPARQGGGG